MPCMPLVRKMHACADAWLDRIKSSNGLFLEAGHLITPVRLGGGDVKQVVGDYLGAALGSQWMSPTGTTAKRMVNRMVAHCCDAKMNLKLTAQTPHGLLPFPNEFDLCAIY